MRTLLIALLLSVLMGCETMPQNPENWMVRERNACLPTAISMSQGLRRQGITSKVVRYSYQRNGRMLGHAITAYLYPPGANKLYTYDYEGSWRTHVFWNDNAGIARAAESLRGRNEAILSAEEL